MRPPVLFVGLDEISEPGAMSGKGRRIDIPSVLPRHLPCEVEHLGGSAGDTMYKIDQNIRLRV